jgi:predicted transposase/invertase (TIGR01784 family)
LKNCENQKNETKKSKVNLEEVLKDWEMKLVWDAAFEDGKTKAQKEIAKNMLSDGLAIELIAKTTGLTPAEIENLSDENFDDD